jgi:leucyl aminopeptidase
LRPILSDKPRKKAMNISIMQGSIQESVADTIIVNLFKDVTNPGGATGAVDRALNGAISELIANGDLKGKSNEVAVFYPRGAVPAKRVLIVGLGDAANFNLEGVRQAAATAIKRAQKLNAKHVATIVHGAGIAGLPASASAQATIEGSLLALYAYDADKKKKSSRNELESLSVVEFDAGKLEEIRAGASAAEAIAAGVSLARDLVNMPPNVATPTKMAATASEIAADHPMKITIGGREWAAERDMGAFLAVAKGAGEPPKFIVL